MKTIIVMTIICTILGCANETKKNNAPDSHNKTDNDFLSGPITIKYLASEKDTTEKIYSRKATPYLASHLINSLYWHDFNMVWIENQQGDVLEVSGSYYDGFSASYKDYFEGKLVEHKIVSRPPKVPHEMAIILRLAITRGPFVKEAYFYE
jgi:hypothetical protein